jgi:outer membrane protein assembly factor BamB
MIKLSLSFALSMLLLNVGCSSLKLSGESSGKRSFLVRKDWVRQTNAKDNFAFRKINRNRPLIFGDLVLSGNALDGMVAYNRQSGREIWRLPITNGVEPSATLINDRLFFGASDGQFYSVNAKTGAVLWTFPTRIENLSEPLLEDGVLYFLSGANTLYALDAATGKQLWLYSRQDPSSLSIRGGSKPAYRNGTLYVGFSDGALVALLAKNGALKWEKQLNRNKKFRDLDTNPLVENDYLYALGFDDAIYCLRAATGDVVWKAEHGGYGSPLISGELLYYPSSSNEFIALNKVTGQKVWAHALREGIATSASFYKGLIVFGESQGKLIFLDAVSGKLISSFEPGRGVFSPPLVDEKNSRVYFISNEANLYALEAKWGFRSRIPYLEPERGLQ